MTYADLQAALTEWRAEDPTRLKRLLDASYSKLWHLHDWSFKHVHNASLTISAGDRTPTMPVDFGGVEGLYDDNGVKVEPLSPDEWSYHFSDDTATGTPSWYTVARDDQAVGHQIFLAPIPGAATFKIDYRRRLSHLASGTTLTPGPMDTDTDEPLWPEEHHYLIAVDAEISRRQWKPQRDFPASELKPQRDELLEAMRSDLLAGNQVAEPMFWGA